MSVPPELPERIELRNSLRSLERHITELKPDHQIEMFSSEIDQIRFLPMVLDEASKDRPTYFTLLNGFFLEIPDDNYDDENEMEYDSYGTISEYWREPRICAQAIDIYWSRYLSNYSLGIQPLGGDIVFSPVNILNSVYDDLYRHEYPEFGLYDLEQVTKGPYAHLKATIYNGLNAHNDYILQGELLLILRLMIAHIRRTRFVDHIVAPVMAFSFMGPQHARVIEAYLDGHTVVVRPTQLYDLRTKDAAAFKTFTQWYFGKPRGPTGTSQ